MLVVFEGIDGSGKTALSKSVLEELIAMGYDAVRFFEPTNMKWGHQIRRVFELGQRLKPEDELLLFMNDRYDDVEKQIKPALNEKKIVLLDRYYFSSAAYQGAEGLDWKTIVKNNEKFCAKPSAVFFLAIHPNVALERIKKEGRKNTAPEKLETLTKIDAVYREMFASIKGKSFDVVVLDSARPLVELKTAVIDKITAVASSLKTAKNTAGYGS